MGCALDIQLRNGGDTPFAALVGLRLDGAGDPNARRDGRDIARGKGVDPFRPAGSRLVDVGLQDLLLGFERGLQRGIVGDGQVAVLVEIPAAGRLHQDADEAGVVDVKAEHLLAGLGFHGLADLDEAVPGQVLHVLRLETGLFEIVLAVIEAGDAGIEGHAVDGAVERHQLDLVGRKAREIDLARQFGEGAGEGLEVFLRAVVFDQYDIRQRVRGAGRQARLELLLDVGLGEIDDVEGRVRMLRRIARGGFLHNGDVEVRVPAPDGDFAGKGGRGCQEARTGKQAGGKARQNHLVHRFLPRNLCGRDLLSRRRREDLPNFRKRARKI